ncbi:hypothetical protein [Microbacterium sp. NPDC056569]|uniref:hypothetical protein n=1 Tax=Microbacterium sp. NPDC056569 TaxID=3345867 RepID=UPI003670BE95
MSALSTLTAQLGALGFRRAGHNLVVPLSDGYAGWLGLNKATRGLPKGMCELNPMIGVSDRRVEATLASSNIPRAGTGKQATIVQPLYRIAGVPYGEWILDDADPEGSVKPVMIAMVEAGLPFMKRMSDPKAMIDALMSQRGGLGDAEIRLPLLLAGLGRVDQAHQAIDDALARLGHDEGSLALRQIVQWERDYLDRNASRTDSMGV